MINNKILEPKVERYFKSMMLAPFQVLASMEFDRPTTIPVVLGHNHHIKYLMNDEEITEPLSSDFADSHITANPGHLEYRTVIEMPSAKDLNSKPTRVFDDDAEKH